MWTWNSDPFGTDAANPNPAGAGPFTFNLRFPGQVFDGQAGLHQNGFRDYDPSLARYVETDPLGLQGGVNAFTYAMGNPLSNIDPLGLTAEDVRAIDEYIGWVFPDIDRRGGYEFGAPNEGASGSTDPSTGITTLPAAIKCKKLSLDEFRALFDTMLHESMHSTDTPQMAAWDSLWGNGAHISYNHRAIQNRVSYETASGHRWRPNGPMWGHPGKNAPDVDWLYNISRDPGDNVPCGCQ